jgi:malonyl CoA-acyl carrier protein transacylase/phosphopantetheinyl transferase (holo-ACP synthase)
MSESPSNNDADDNLIAIVGMSCIDQHTTDLISFWISIVESQEAAASAINGENAIHPLKAIKDALSDIKQEADQGNGLHVKLVTTKPAGENENAFALPGPDLGELLFEVKAACHGQIDDQVEFCPSALSAINHAITLLRARDSDLVVVFGATLDKPSAKASSAYEDTAAIVLGRLSDALARGARIYGCIEQIALPSATLTSASESHYVPQSNARFTSLCIQSAVSRQAVVGALRSVITSALALYHRVLPPGISVGKIVSKDGLIYEESFLNTQLRPWIHPKEHPELLLDKSILGPGANRRRALIKEYGSAGDTANLLISEALDDYFAVQAHLFETSDTELFTFASRNLEQLLIKLRSFRGFLAGHSKLSLKNIAYSLNCKTKDASLSADKHKVARLAIVASTHEDLVQKLERAINELTNENSSAIQYDLLGAIGIYLSDPKDEAVNSGKLAFLLPGLGSAYPNMLSKLCIHFPEVRSIFDFVDYLAEDAGSKDLPSDIIFPKPNLEGRESSSATAALVEMDAAVVTVLMAEWAMFTVFLKLGIVPDVLVGCSTGEFAALTMSGAASILAASRLFYRLSTEVANSLPKARLATLRSIKVKSALATFDQHLGQYQNKVYLSGDLSNKQVILTGEKKSIAQLVSTLEDLDIEVDYLPVAIPYHTALVAGAINQNSAELENLEISEPAISSWSCSIASEYPKDSLRIKQLTTELFSQPILFKRTILRLYESVGVTKFLEVGPKDVLTPVIGEILEEKPFIAVPSNRASGSAVSHLNNALAKLFSCGVPINCEYLYARRNPQEIVFAVDTETEPVLEQKRVLERTSSFSVPQKAGSLSGSGAVNANVMNAFLENLALFHKDLMQKQASVMSAYLERQQENVRLKSGQLKTKSQRFPLLNNARISRLACGVCVELRLSLDWHHYLQDHAIGGEVDHDGQKIYLLPLTVALEMMAEAASLLMPGMLVVRLSNIRAYKRIRVGKEGMIIRLIAEPIEKESGMVSVSIVREEIQLKDSLNESEKLMACDVVFANNYKTDERTEKPPMQAITPTAKPKSTSLYGPGSMFHGPRMQSVLSIEGVSDLSIYGSAEARQVHDWFPAQAAEPNFLIDPLLLDNSTQFVLYHLFERNEPVDALLPFMIDFLDIYKPLSELSGQVSVYVKFNSQSSRGTDAEISIANSDKEVIAHFHSIKSRRIILDEPWRSFVQDPGSIHLSQSTSTLFEHSLDGENLVHRLMTEDELPSDEATLAWCADYVLTSTETKIFESLSNGKRKREWLLGRICAKDAIRLLLNRNRQDDLKCADIEILADAAGSPAAKLASNHVVPGSLHVSITHKAGLGLAAVMLGSSRQGIGIDLEKIESREDNLEDLLMCASEKVIMADWLRVDRQSALATLWSGKEAAAKALRTGLQYDPKSIELMTMERATEKCKLVMRSRPLSRTLSVTVFEASSARLFSECIF